VLKSAYITLKYVLLFMLWPIYNNTRSTKKVITMTIGNNVVLQYCLSILRRNMKSIDLYE
ncbi:hypothetical protein, partial [Bacillus cereus]|uniref:hypothetical protein n=1 Tax=Bacillus cereus TaxID=1396 RepID=UPI0019554333